MKIRRRVGNRIRQGGFKTLIRYRNQWERAIIPSLVLAAILSFVIASTRGAAPGLQLGAFTNDGVHNYVWVNVTNATGTNGYQIQTREALDSTFGWVANVIGGYGQSNFLVEIGSKQTMFFRAFDCTNCDSDLYPWWDDANDTNSAVGLFSTIILSPTNGATLY